MKRFTETQKWEDPWFRKLKPELKLLWQWLLDRCDNAGVIDPDIELASFQIGYQYPMDTLLAFKERVVKLGCGKHFIPKFIQFQYGQLSTDCKAHKPIFMSLQKHSVAGDLIGYQYPIGTLQEKETATEQVKDKEKEKEKSEHSPLDFAKSKPDSPHRRATMEEVYKMGRGQLPPISDECCEKFHDRMTGEGWINKQGFPLNDWRGRFREWAGAWATNSSNPNRNQK